MTPLESQLLARITARASRLQPELAKRLLAAYRLIRDNLTTTEMTRLIQGGNAERLIDELLNDQALENAFRPLRVYVDQAVMDAGNLASRDLPSPLRGQVFDVLNPKVIEAARTLDTRVITGLKVEVRETVRQHVIAGLEEGVGPSTIARGIRDVVALAPNQEAAVRNFRRMLEEGDAEAFTRKLRDRRFDRTLAKAFAEDGKLPVAKIDTMTDAYRRRMVALNAETQTRSAAVDAMRAGQRASWEEAIERGAVDRSALFKTWVTVGDDRVRPEHAAMNGQRVPFDQPYSNGDMVPGQGDYNCRCIERISIVRGSVPLAA